LPYEALAIFAVVLFNAILGYVQEARAASAVAALRKMAAAHAHVIRDGERRNVPATDVVPGDIIVIEEGDTIPADARLLQVAALQTAESALTGESLPVTKDLLPIADEVAAGDRHNMVFSGTAVTYGRGTAVVIATGMQTEMGRIAGLLEQTKAETTPLQKELARVGRMLGIVAKRATGQRPRRRRGQGAGLPARVRLTHGTRMHADHDRYWRGGQSRRRSPGEVCSRWREPVTLCAPPMSSSSIMAPP